jgi:hypothetical protein
MSVFLNLFFCCFFVFSALSEDVINDAFFRAHFPYRNYSIPNTQFLDLDGQAAKAWYAAAFMNETITRLGAASGIFALLLENEAYYQNDVPPFSLTQSTPQWQTAAGS